MNTKTKLKSIALALERACKLIKEIKDKHKPKDDVIPLMQITSEIDIIPRNTQNIVDSIECPMCRGVFNYRISIENGHIAGSCENKDCLSIIA